MKYDYSEITHTDFTEHVERAFRPIKEKGFYFKWKNNRVALAASDIYPSREAAMAALDRNINFTNSLFTYICKKRGKPNEYKCFVTGQKIREGCSGKESQDVLSPEYFEIRNLLRNAALHICKQFIKDGTLEIVEVK